MNHRDNFRVFLSNPLVEPDSSSAERCIRSVAVLREACDFKQSIEYMDSLCVYFTLVETSKMHGFNAAMTMEWLQDFGCAYYLHRANATLTHEVNNRGRRLDNKLMGFTPEVFEMLSMGVETCREVIENAGEVERIQAHDAAMSGRFKVCNVKSAITTVESRLRLGSRKALLPFRNWGFG